MWQRSDDWIGSLIDDSFVMISLEHGNYVALNATAASAWELLADPQDEDMLVTALTEKFEVAPDRCRSAVRALLADMAGKDLVHSVA